VPRQFVFLGESNGGRIICLAGAPLTQITTGGSVDSLLDVETWDMVPMGEAGDCVFRMVIVTVKYSNGFSIRVTPKVDDVALASQDFSQQGSGTFACEAYVVSRGAKLSVRVQQLTRTGDLELVNIKAAYLPLREVP
jgi:hypothetical protein